MHSHNRWYFLFVKGNSSGCSKIKIYMYLNYNWRMKSCMEVMVDVRLLFKYINTQTNSQLSLWQMAEQYSLISVIVTKEVFIYAFITKQYLLETLVVYIVSSIAK